MNNKYIDNIKDKVIKEIFTLIYNRDPRLVKLSDEAIEYMGDFILSCETIIADNKTQEIIKKMVCGELRV